MKSGPWHCWSVAFNSWKYIVHSFYPRYVDKQMLAKNVDPDESAPEFDQFVDCLSFHLHILDTLPVVK